VRVTVAPAADPGYLSSWLLHRLAIGVMGVAMPVILIVGEHVLFSRDVVDFPRASLSAYYYSGLRDVFVATLVATGVFLITFKISHGDRFDNIISTVAGLAALGVAYDPTGPDAGEVAPPWSRLIGVHTCQAIHYMSAALSIGALAVMSARFAQHARPRLAVLHVACSVVMLVTALVAVVASGAGVQRVGSFSGLLIVELVCTYAFGVSWLVRGLEIRHDMQAAGV
jgi:hypothetical protein